MCILKKIFLRTCLKQNKIKQFAVFLWTDPISSIYQKIGSEDPIYRLVDIFYTIVEKDALLRPLYPDDLTESRKHLAWFLIQRFGGAPTYSQLRGHPRMRARHMPFKIGLQEKNAWMNNMNKALDQIQEFASYRLILKEYFEEFATFMINQPN